MGDLGLQIPLDWKGAVVAAAVVAFPLFLMIARVAFERCDPRLEEAARTLHAGPLRVFATITLPQALPGLAAAAAVTFARAFGEFGATMMLAGNIPGQTRTVPQAIYSSLLAGHEGAAWGLTLVSFAVGVAAIVASQLLIRKLPGLTSPGAKNA
jgi:molybdate transport system permease protein